MDVKRYCPVIFTFIILIRHVLTSGGIRNGYFMRLEGFNGYVVKVSALWSRKSSARLSTCIIACLGDLNCKSVFFNKASADCTGHSTVFTTTLSATTEADTIYFENITPTDQTTPTITAAPTTAARTTLPTTTTTTTTTKTPTTTTPTPTSTATTTATTTKTPTTTTTTTTSTTPTTTTTTTTTTTPTTTTTTTTTTTPTTTTTTTPTTTTTTTTTPTTTATTTTPTTTTTTTTPTTTTTTTTTTTPTTTTTTTPTTTTTITTTPTTTATTTTPTTTTTTTTPTTTTTTTTTTAAPVTGPVTYTYHSTKKFWNAARTTCIQNGGDMASLDTQERFDAVKKFLNNRKSSGKSIANSLLVGITRSSTDGQLYWTNGAIMDNNDIWTSGHPRAGQSCGYTSFFKGMTYKSYTCSSFQSRFLCQTPA